MTRDDALDRVMLTLAAVTYGGFALPGAVSSELGAAMTAVLAELGPVKDQWTVEWGPASFRAGLDTFDDAAMFVARNHQRPSQLVIAVRGTNPISGFDWLFGDLMVRRQVPWPYGQSPDAAARVSFSTALGLSILQHLRYTASGAAAPAPAGQLRDRLAAAFPVLTAHVEQLLDTLRGQLTAGVRAAAATAKGLNHLPVTSWVGILREQESHAQAARALQALDEALASPDGARFDPLQLVLGGTQVQQSFAGGVTLQDFLRALTASATEPLDVYVTGHSKGGALCVALATWLADTQGVDPPSAEQWDPQRVATVHSYGFAGPTPGNAAFARHVDAVLAERCHRIVNRLDVVPHAFATADLAVIADLYDSPPLERAALTQLSRHLAANLDHLDYQHPGKDVLELPGIPRPGKPLVEQLAHQHLDGYFEQLKLDMRTATFFNPVAGVLRVPPGTTRRATRPQA
jgi:hypothetical protein